jgi:hypothetical protein
MPAPLTATSSTQKKRRNRSSNAIPDAYRVSGFLLNGKIIRTELLAPGICHYFAFLWTSRIIDLFASCC